MRLEALLVRFVKIKRRSRNRFRVWLNFVSFRNRSHTAIEECTSNELKAVNYTKASSFSSKNKSQSVSDQKSFFCCVSSWHIVWRRRHKNKQRNFLKCPLSVAFKIIILTILKRHTGIKKQFDREATRPLATVKKWIQTLTFRTSVFRRNLVRGLTSETASVIIFNFQKSSLSLKLFCTILENC